VHGNGPQVGNLALQQESITMVPGQPLALLSAMTQGTRTGAPASNSARPGRGAARTGDIGRC